MVASLALGVGGALLVVGVGSARRRAPSGGGGQAPIVAVEIADRVRWLDLGGRSQTNVYLVRGPHGWVLVDAGWSGDATRIEAAVRDALGSHERPLAVLLTHVHPDHSGAARALAEAWGCPILLHPAEIPIAEGDFAAMERFAGPLDRWVILPMMRMMGRQRRAAVLSRSRLGPGARELPPDGTVPGLEGWRWLGTPGHTPGHVSFVRDADGVVLTGDALLTLRVNDAAGMLLGAQGLSGPPWYTTWSATRARESIAALADLGPSAVCGGHGRPVTGADTAGRVRALVRPR